MILLLWLYFWSHELWLCSLIENLFTGYNSPCTLKVLQSVCLGDFSYPVQFRNIRWANPVICKIIKSGYFINYCWVIPSVSVRYCKILAANPWCAKHFFDRPISNSKSLRDKPFRSRCDMALDSISWPRVCIARIICQFIRGLLFSLIVPTQLHVTKKLPLNPYLSRIGIALK